MKKEQNYWSQRYQEERTGWDIGYPSTPLKTYIDQLEDKPIKILIPGAGNAYEAEYLWQQGFTNVFIMDISPVPLEAFQKRNPDFPQTQLLHEDFFTHQDQYDLIFEQTFFCSFVPTDENRFTYAKHMNTLLKPKGKLVGVWFDIPLTGDMEKRPFGGDTALYLKYLGKHLNVITFEKCYNSIPPRQGNELFGIFSKRHPHLN
ncbi:methyltransferase domain-containing protein [Croceitalea sp. MTPC9]|uniref:methyltransferase domain-containing protein n=1 Tax=unclassified Croceitalea TaxID=2632280 RepID=UPI002B3B8D71|nr:methyltransferase domain-containing protein [Croceitalea sp. MTPC6]GMN15353.1 methyltransferase domain-containing protein [Croceitalea sp. MTPC9]